MSVITITKDNFEDEVINSSLPVLVDFWAPWCGPCRTVGPLVDEVAAEMVGEAKVGKINVDEQQELAMNFQVMSIPTLAVFKGGKLIKTSVGARGKDQIKAMLEE